MMAILRPSSFSFGLLSYDLHFYRQLRPEKANPRGSLSTAQVGNLEETDEAGEADRYEPDDRFNCQDAI